MRSSSSFAAVDVSILDDALFCVSFTPAPAALTGDSLLSMTLSNSDSKALTFVRRLSGEVEPTGAETGASGPSDPPRAVPTALSDARSDAEGKSSQCARIRD